MDQPASIIVHSGKVFTADPEMPWAQAVAISGNRIAAVGSDQSVLLLGSDNTLSIDLGGRVVIPGLNDAHVHVSFPSDHVHHLEQGSQRPSNPGIEELLDQVRQAVAQTAPRTVLFGRIGPRILDDAQATRFALDEAAPEHPVYLQSFTGNGQLLNTAALQLAGIAENEPDGFGGWFERIAETDTVSGIVHGYAHFRLFRSNGLWQCDIANCERYAKRAVGWGITSLQDMDIPFTPEAKLAALREVELPLRWRLARFLYDGPESPAARLKVQDTPSKVEVSGHKWILDGTSYERFAVRRDPYPDRPGWYGRYYVPEPHMRRAVEVALAQREQLHAHVAGDCATETLFSVMREVQKADRWPALRPRIEHATGLVPDLFADALELGIVAVLTPVYCNLARSLAEAGIPIAIGPDSPGNPFFQMMVITTRPDNLGEALTREQAVTAYTRGSAYAEKQEHVKGTLKPGMLADLAVLSQDIFAVAPNALPETTSLLTIVDGEIVHSAGAFDA